MLIWLYDGHELAWLRFKVCLDCLAATILVDVEAAAKATAFA